MPGLCKLQTWDIKSSEILPSEIKPSEIKPSDMVFYVECFVSRKDCIDPMYYVEIPCCPIISPRYQLGKGGKHDRVQV